jgi:trimeric autotransporter adhesin
LAAVNHNIQLKLTADGSAFVGEVRVARDELDKLSATAKQTSTAMHGVGGGQVAGQMAATAQRAAAMATASQTAGTAAGAAAAGVRSLGVGAVGAALGLTGAVTAAGMFAISSVKTAEAAAALDRRLIMLTGTGAALAETKGWLADSANRLGKLLPEIADGYARLNPMMRSGLLTTGQARDLTLGLIDAQIAFGASSDSMGNVLYGLSQALSAPIVHMEELNQVVEPLPGLLADLDKAAGLPAGGFRKLVAEGKATSAMFRDTLAKALKTHEGTAAQAATGFEGATGRMAEAWRKLMTSFGEGVGPVVVKAISVATDLMEGLLAEQKVASAKIAADELIKQTRELKRLAALRDAALVDVYRYAEGAGGVYAQKNRTMAERELSAIDQDIAKTEAAIIELEKRLGQADRSLTGALNAAAGKTGAQAGTARTAADELRGAWVAAAEAAGLQTNAIGGLTTAQDDLTRHANALAKVAALPAEELKKLGITAADVARVVVKLTEAIDPVTAAIKRLNDETGAINAGKFKDLRELMSAARPMQGRPTSDDQGTGDLVDAWSRNRKTGAEEQVRLAREAAKASRELAEAQATGEPKIIAFAQAAADTKKALAEGIIRPAEEADYYAAKLDEQMAHLAGSMGAAAAEYDKSADVQILAAQRLAEAQLQGADAVREAEIVNRAAAEADKERVALDSARGQAILAKVRAEEQWKKAANDNAAIRAANDNLSDLRAEIALMGQSEAVRDRAIKSIQIQRQAVQQFGSATSDAARQWIGLQEQIADAEALKRFEEDVNRVSKEISTDVATAMFEGMSGSETDIMAWFRKLLKRMAVEILATQFIMPITTSVVSAVPGLFGISAPVTGAQAAAALAGQQQGGFGSAGNLLSLGSKFVPSSWTSGVGETVNAWGADLLGTGMPATVMSSSAAQTAWAAQTAAMEAGGGLAGSSSLITGVTPAVGGAPLTAYFGSAGAGALGGMLGGMIGTSAQSKAVGAASGALLGAGSAGLASLMGLSAAGGPVGLAIGAVVGAITGALGTQKKAKTEASAYAVMDGAGRVSDSGSATRNADAGPVQAAAQAVTSAVQALVLAGGKMSPASVDLRTVNGGAMEAWVNGFAGQKVAQADDPNELVKAYIRAVATTRFDGATIGAGDPTLQLSALGRRAAETAGSSGADYVATIALAEQVAAGQSALDALDKSLAGLTSSAKKAALEGFEPLAAELAKAQDGGFGAEWRDVVGGRVQAMLDAMINPVEYTALETALAGAAGQMQALRQAGDDLGLGLTGAIDAAEAAVKGRLLAQGYDQMDRALNDAGGRGWINSLRDAQAEMEVNRRQLAALGGDAARADALAGAKVRSIIDGLSTADAAAAVGVLSGSLGDLVRAAVDAKATADAAAAAQAAAAQAAAQAAAAADLDVRRLAAAGDAAGAEALSASLRRQAEVTAALAAGYDDAYIAALRAVHAMEAEAAAAKTAAAARADLAQRYQAVGGQDAAARINALRAQAGADAVIDLSQAVAVLRAGVVAVAADLPTAELAALAAAFGDAKVAGGALADELARRNAADAARLALEDRQSRDTLYISSLSSLSSQARAAAGSMRALGDALSALPDRLALDGDLSPLDAAGRLDAAWAQLGAALSGAITGVSADLVARVQAGDVGAAAQLDAAIRGGAIDAGKASGIEGLIEAVIRQSRSYYADLPQYNATYDALTAIAAATAAAANDNASALDDAAAATDRQITALGGTAAALDRNIASMADLRAALDDAAAAWRSPSVGGAGDAALTLASQGGQALLGSLGIDYGVVKDHAALLGGNTSQAAAWAAAASLSGYRGAAGHGEISAYLAQRLAADPNDAAARQTLYLGDRINADPSHSYDVLAEIAVARAMGYQGGYGPGQLDAYAAAAGPEWRAKYDAAMSVARQGAWGVRAYADGGPIVDGGLIAGGVAGRDSALVLAMPGERILSTRQSDMMDTIHAAALRQGGGVSVSVDLAPVAASITAGSAATIRAIDASAGRIVGAVDGLGADIAALARKVDDQSREIRDLRALLAQRRVA